MNKEVRLVDAVRLCPYGQRTLERWVSAYKHQGAEGLEPQSTRPKSQPGDTSRHIKPRE